MKLLLEYIEEHGNRTIYKRLGYLVERLEINASDVIECCQENISAGYSLLDPNIDNQGKFVRRWNLQVNSNLVL